MPMFFGLMLASLGILILLVSGITKINVGAITLEELASKTKLYLFGIAIVCLFTIACLLIMTSTLMEKGLI